MDLSALDPVGGEVLAEPVLRVLNEVVQYLRQPALVHPDLDINEWSVHDKLDGSPRESLAVVLGELIHEPEQAEDLALLTYISERRRQVAQLPSDGRHSRTDMLEVGEDLRIST